MQPMEKLALIIALIISAFLPVLAMATDFEHVPAGETKTMKSQNNKETACSVFSLCCLL